MRTEELIATFFRLLKEHPKLELKNKIPESMLIPSKNHLQNRLWQPIGNQLLHPSDFEKFESILERTLPASYKAWLLSAHFFPIRIGSLSIFGNHPIQPLSEIKEVFNDNLIQAGLFPIGIHGWSLQILVFDLNSSAKEPPLKLFTPTNEFHSFKLESQIVFSTFNHLLACWNFENGEAMENKIGQKDIYKQYIKMDPPSKLYWEKVISDMEDWSDMNP